MKKTALIITIFLSVLPALLAQGAPDLDDPTLSRVTREERRARNRKLQEEMARNYDKRPELQVDFLGVGFPWGMGPGFLGSVAYILKIDSRVHLGFNLDYFTAVYESEITNTSTTNSIDTTEASQRTSANQLPLSMFARINFLIPESIITPYAQVGIGWENLFSKSENIENASENAFEFYSGFNINIGGGMWILLGERTKWFVHAGYKIVPGNAKRITSNNPTDTTLASVNSSGFYLKTGMSFLLGNKR